MRFSILLFVLSNVLKIASLTNKTYKKYINREESMAEIFGGHLVAKYMKEVENIDIVFTISDIIPALKRAVESGKPACINVVTDPTVTSPATVMFYQNFAEL